jgi:hypothetical protein
VLESELAMISTLGQRLIGEIAAHAIYLAEVNLASCMHVNSYGDVRGARFARLRRFGKTSQRENLPHDVIIT